MSENNKSYRLKCNKEESEYLKLNITQDFDFLDVMSLKITQEDVYKLYTSDYGVVVGRVLANDGFGIPNAKISIFIPNNSENKTLDRNISYPYTTTSDKNNDGIRYNLLPESNQTLCYQNVGTMLSKRDVLDNDVELDVYNNFYKYTTTTNESGDYMIFGVPVGTQSLHVDIDLSDIGILSQTPRDMIYKGYNLKSFESPNKFKKSTNLDSLPQIITQDTTVFVYPFWGDETQGEIAISKKNINIQYKFEPTCVFMGSVFTDSTKSGISKNCKPSKTSGKMSEMMATQGLIEMIRKTPDGNVEQFDINGGRVINNDGVWCYQIPMNLDYMITDEYGNLIPTDDPTIGIPTRAEVRFRVTIDDNGDTFTQTKTASYLIPNNPKTTELEDYEFNENCKDGSFVNLFWNKVYSVKNYIPRLQIGDSATKRTFLGLKSTNYHESNNPAPYNKLFIDLNLRFKIMCLLSKFYVQLIGWINTWVITIINYYLLSDSKELSMIMLDKEFLDDCSFLPTDIEDFEYFVPIFKNNFKFITKEFLGATILGGYNKKNNSDRSRDEADVRVTNDGAAQIKNSSGEWHTLSWNSGVSGNINYNVKVCFELTTNQDYIYGKFHPTLTNDLIDCLETNLSSSSEVVNFDFNNDWLNGSLYAPRFLTKTRVNRKTGKKEVKFCGSKNNYSNLHLVNTCATAINTNSTTPSLISNANTDCQKGDCYEQSEDINTNLGNILYNISSDNFIYKSNFTNNGKLLYYHPTDIILLGGLSENDNDGIPKLHQLLPPTSFKMVDDVVEEEISGDTITKLSSGIDWSNDNSEISGGLFTSIGCLNSITLIKSCVNAERLCEIGVDYDENYDFTDYNGTTIITKNVDGFISLDELSEGDSRGMFATLNRNGLKTVNNQYGLKKYDFKYVYPTGFDGKLSVNLTYDNSVNIVGDSNYLSTDAKSIEYNKFRFGNDTGGSYSYDTSYKLPRYENSFYFYFGLKQGSTALDLFNTQYYAPCKYPETDAFVVELTLLSNETICPGNDGSILLTVSNNTQYPYKVYINEILHSSNNETSLKILSGLINGYKNIKVVDGNNDSVIRSIFLPKNDGIDFEYSTTNSTSEDSYAPNGSITISNITNDNSENDFYYVDINFHDDYIQVDSKTEYFTGTTHTINNLGYSNTKYLITVYENGCIFNNSYAQNVEILGTPYVNITGSSQTPATVVVGKDSINIYGSIVNTQGSNVTESGIVCGTNSSPIKGGVGVDYVLNYGNVTPFDTSINLLTPYTLYYLRGYGVNGIGTGYSSNVMFRTLSDIPVILTSTPTNLTETGATVGGYGIVLNDEQIVSKGVVLTTVMPVTTGIYGGNPIINRTIDSGSGDGIFTNNQGPLTVIVSPNPIPIEEIDTNQFRIPSTATGVFNVDLYNNFIIHMTVNSSVTGETWIQLYNCSVTFRNVFLLVSSGNDTFDLTNYYLYVDDVGNGVVVSEMNSKIPYIFENNRSFQNVELLLNQYLYFSEVKTDNIFTSISGIESVLIIRDIGEDYSRIIDITSVGDGPMTLYSTEYNTNDFSLNVTGLTPGETYYVRAFATNGVGIGYGESIEFTSLTPVPPNSVPELFVRMATGATTEDPADGVIGFKTTGATTPITIYGSETENGTYEEYLPNVVNNVESLLDGIPVSLVGTTFYFKMIDANNNVDITPFTISSTETQY